MHPDLGYYDEGLDLTDPALYRAARRPLGEAEVLPPFAFRSKLFSDLEDERIWTRGWIAIGTQQQLPNPGDLLPFTVGFHGLHVQRNADGSLTGRFNKAQHGGCRSVPLQCQTGRKTRCSFTSCGYSRDRDVIPAGELGDLTPAMQQYLGLVPERLLPVRVETWGPFIFVNLDPAAPPLATALRGLPRWIGERLDGRLSVLSTAWVESRANWKLTARAHLAASRPWSREMAVARAGEILSHDAQHVLRAGGEGTTQLWLFPNLLLTLHADWLAYAVLQPTAMTDSLQRFGLLSAVPDATLRQACLARLEAVAASAASEQERAAAWGTSAWPESRTRALPLEGDAAAHAFQLYLIDGILAAPEAQRTLPLYRAAGLRSA